MFDVLQDWAFTTKFNLIYSSDVFVYFGNLDTIIKSISSSLVDGGMIAFSVEKLKDYAVDYKLYPSGRYAYSRKYIQERLGQHGFKKIKINETDIRNQSGNPFRGLLVAAKK